MQNLGVVLCVEFSKIDNEIINLLYQQYSKAVPLIGKYIVGSSSPYDYLVKSIKEFYNQDELSDLIKKMDFLMLNIEIFLMVFLLYLWMENLNV